MLVVCFDVGGVLGPNIGSYRGDKSTMAPTPGALEGLRRLKAEGRFRPAIVSFAKKASVVEASKDWLKRAGFMEFFAPEDCRFVADIPTKIRTILETGCHVMVDDNAQVLRDLSKAADGEGQALRLFLLAPPPTRLKSHRGVYDLVGSWPELVERLLLAASEIASNVVDDEVESILDAACRLRDAHHLDRATAYFARAIDLHRDRGDYHYWRAECFLLKGDTGEALLDLDHAIEKTPDYKLARFQRGVVRYRMGNFNGAREDFKSCGPGFGIDAAEIASTLTHLDIRDDRLRGLDAFYSETAAELKR